MEIVFDQINNNKKNRNKNKSYQTQSVSLSTKTVRKQQQASQKKNTQGEANKKDKKPQLPDTQYCIFGRI